MIRWVFIFLCIAAVPLSSAAATRAVVVGIDSYAAPGIANLSGAVNDARDIAAALSERGAEVTLILDRDATRARVLSALEAAIAASRAGDALVFHFAGHGVQTPEAVREDEIDGMDENLVLHGFAPEGAGLAERIRDDEIARLLETVPREVAVLLVIDSCHSGTPTRNSYAGLPSLRMRTAGAMMTLDNDPLPLPPPGMSDFDSRRMPNVLLVTAAQDNQQTPELEIGGSMRGALSWSVARALRGTAGARDGETSLGDFRLFVRQQVRGLARAQQTPDVRILGGRDEGAGGFEGPIAPLAPLFERRLDAGGNAPNLAPLPKVLVTGGARPDWLDEVALQARDAVSADLVWDRRTGRLLAPDTGDLLSEIPGEAEARTALLSWQAAARLVGWAPMRPAEVALDPGDGRHALGKKLHIVLHRPATRFSDLVLFNLASDGTVQFLGQVPLAGQPAKLRLGSVTVIEPVGSDLIVAVFLDGGAAPLAGQLAALDGKREPGRAVDLLMDAAGRHDLRVGLQPMFTMREGAE